MSLAQSPLSILPVMGLALWLCGVCRPGAAEEAATAIPAPSVRPGAATPCRIVLPTFELKAPSRDAVMPTRYPGGAKLSLPVAAPCPAKPQTLDL